MKITNLTLELVVCGMVCICKCVSSEKMKYMDLVKEEWNILFVYKEREREFDFILLLFSLATYINANKSKNDYFLNQGRD